MEPEVKIYFFKLITIIYISKNIPRRLYYSVFLVFRYLYLEVSYSFLFHK